MGIYQQPMDAPRCPDHLAARYDKRGALRDVQPVNTFGMGRRYRSVYAAPETLWACPYHGMRYGVMASSEA